MALQDLFKSLSNGISQGASNALNSIGKDLAPVGQFATGSLYGFDTGAKNIASGLTGIAGGLTGNRALQQASQRIGSQAASQQRYINSSIPAHLGANIGSFAFAPSAAINTLHGLGTGINMSGNALGNVVRSNPTLNNYANQAVLSPIGRNIIAPTLTGLATPTLNRTGLDNIATKQNNAVYNNSNLKAFGIQPFQAAGTLAGDPLTYAPMGEAKNIGEAALQFGKYGALSGALEPAKNLQDFLGHVSSQAAINGIFGGLLHGATNPGQTRDLISSALSTLSSSINPHTASTVAKDIGNAISAHQNELTPQMLKQIRDVTIAGEGKTTPGSTIDLKSLTAHFFDNPAYAKLPKQQQATLWNHFLAIYDGAQRNPAEFKQIVSMLNQLHAQGGFASTDLLTGGLASKLGNKGEQTLTVPSEKVVSDRSPMIEAAAAKGGVTPKIQALMDSYQKGDKLPPIPVYEKDGQYVLNKDGWNRYQAQKALGNPTMDVAVQPKFEGTGTAKQAIERAAAQPQTADTVINKVASKANDIYTRSLDRFNPLSHIAAQAGTDSEKTMRNALTGYYGAGSTAQYHLDYQLAPILKSTNVDDLRAVAIAQRDAELAGRGIQGSNTGSDLAKLEASMGPERFQAAKAAADKLYQYQDQMAKDYLVKTGIMSQAQYDAMRSANQKYVPFQRVMDKVDESLGGVPQTKGAGSVASQNVIKGIKGSDKAIHDPLESVVENTYKMVGLGKRQEVAKAIVSLKDKLPEGMIKPLEGKVGDAKNVISLFEDGKVQKYQVPQEVATAAKGMTEQQMNIVTKVFAAPTRIFRATATGINPEFALPNLARDMQTAFVNYGVTPLDWAKAIFSYAKKDELYQQFLKDGGLTSRQSLDRPYLAQTVKELSGGAGRLVQKPSDIVKILAKIGEASEQPTRLATYAKQLGKTGDRSAAAYAAQEGTVNFARRGSDTMPVNAIYAFMNARAQGVDRLVRSLKDDPKGVGARLAFVSAAPALAAYAWNRTQPDYFNPRVVSTNDKQNNFILMLPGQGVDGIRYLKIPKGDVGKVANPMEAALTLLDGQGGDVGSELGSLFSAFSPAQNIGDAIPTALRPIVESAANHDFFTGNPIVPSNKTAYPAGYQDASSTAPIFRTIGQAIQQSPAQLQHLAEGYGTGFTKLAEGATQPLVKAFQPQNVNPKNEQGAAINNIPVVRRFVGGEHQTAAEADATAASQIKGIQSQIQQIQSGISKGAIPASAGVDQINQLEVEMNRLMGQQKNTVSAASGENQPSISQQDVQNAQSHVGLTPTVLTPQQQSRVKTQLSQVKSQLSALQYSKDPNAAQQYALLTKKQQDLQTQLDLSNLATKVNKVASLSASNPLQQGLINSQTHSLATSIGKQVLSGTMTEDQAAPLLQQLNVDPQQLEYSMAKSLSTPDQANYVLSALQNGDSPAILIKNGVLTSAVVDALYSTGSISADQANYLKGGVKAIAKLGKATPVKVAKAKKAKTIKLPKAPTYKLPSIKSSGSASFTAPKVKGIKVKGIKTGSIKTPKLSVKSISAPSASIKIAKASGANFRLPRQKVDTGVRGF